MTGKLIETGRAGQPSVKKMNLRSKYCYVCNKNLSNFKYLLQGIFCGDILE